MPKWYNYVSTKSELLLTAGSFSVAWTQVLCSSWSVACAPLHRSFQVLSVPTSWPILSHHLLEGFRGREIWSRNTWEDCRILFVVVKSHKSQGALGLLTTDRTPIFLPRESPWKRSFWNWEPNYPNRRVSFRVHLSAWRPPTSRRRAWSSSSSASVGALGQGMGQEIGGPSRLPTCAVNGQWPERLGDGGDWCDIPEPPVPSVIIEAEEEMWGVKGSRRPQAEWPERQTLEHTHPSQMWTPLVISAFGNCFVVSVTRTHDVLKKARTNLEVRKPLHRSEQTVTVCIRMHRWLLTCADLPRGNFWSTCESTGSQWTSL